MKGLKVIELGLKVLMCLGILHLFLSVLQIYLLVGA